ncbi:guanine deaminase [Aspergillus alliaceus]|uniref:guanine deaminase n=1 Tax=Petromyces alliaceus TaxID=209559 RepID=UPI0012A5C34F|nr:guanine deaminase [Aspergillus alliaceus]KAB8238042.1 guanine deaminase [Aspergillus alliaceus]
MTNRDPEFRHQLGKFRLDSSLTSHVPTPPPPTLPPQTSPQSQPPSLTNPAPLHTQHTSSHSSHVHRSKRVSTACDFCRKRKKKCDFRYPNCSACTRAGVRCTIPPPGPQVASASVPRDQLENLQNRVRWLEDVVRRKTGVSVADRPTGSQLDGEGDPDWWYQVPTVLMGRDTSRSTTSATVSGSSPTDSHSVSTELPNVGEIFRDQLENRRPSVARPVASAPHVLRLASLEDAERVASQYFDSMGYQYPFLNRPEFFTQLRRIYAGEVPPPEVLCTYHITIAIALLINPADGAQANEYYRASQETVSLSLQNEDLSSVRVLLSMALWTMFSTNGPSVWHVLGSALRLAVSLGLHKHRNLSSVMEEEMEKRAFWSLYNLDRLVASTLARPLGIADEDISVSLPREFNDDWTEAPGASAMTIPVQVVRLRRIFSRIYRYLYNNQPPPPPADVSLTLLHFRQELDDWRRNAPVYPAALLYSTSYYDYLYATTLLLMHRPSPRNPTPDATSIVSCGDASIQVIRSYWDSYSVGKLKWIWLTLSQIYFAGITILWCLNQNFLAVKDGHPAAWQPNDQMMRRAIQAVVVVLEEFGKRRPGVERLAESFRQQSTVIFSHLAYQQEQINTQPQSQPPLQPPLQPQLQQQNILVAPPVPMAATLDDVLLVDGSGNVPLIDAQLAEELPSFHGTLIHTPNPTTIEILPDTLLIISKTGKIEYIRPSTKPTDIPTLLKQQNYNPDEFPLSTLRPTEFLIPGFIDTHTHAPQWSQRGLGRGIPLLQWLEEITFAHESKLADPVYAKQLYRLAVQGSLKQGITTACYYGSRHKDASLILAETCLLIGQRALIGKCNMNRHAPDWYVDSSAEESLSDTLEFISAVKKLDDAAGRVTPVITPRFAITCDEPLLRGLGDVVRQYPDIPIQTHFNESHGEIDFTRTLFPEFKNETELYSSFGLLTERTILAHAIYPQPEEIPLLKELGCGVAHCPIPNTTMDEFMVAPVREYLDQGIKVGLGTDCGGGYSSSMLEVMRAAFMVSVAKQTETKGRDRPLSIAESFYLATMGGARVAGLGDRVGRFAVGFEFDACLVRTDVGDGIMAPVEEVVDDAEKVFEKFLMTGDDRNIVKVWVRGREVKGMVA